MSLVVVLAFIATGITVFASSAGPDNMPDHITVARARADTSGESVRVGGNVVPGTVSWDSASGSLTFTLAGDGEELKVSYRGLAPDDFKPGSPLLVEGTYSTAGVFQATSLAATTSPLCKACHG